MGDIDRDPSPDRSIALLVIDLQRALCDLAPPAAIRDVAARIGELIKLAEQQSWPIIVVQHRTEPGTILERGSDGWQLAHPASAIRPDFVVEKEVLSCFADGSLHQWLQANGIERLCITGMQTEYCVSAACEGAAELGYDVLLASDGHMTIDGPEKTATDLVAEVNDRLASVARCVPTERIASAFA